MAVALVLTGCGGGGDANQPPANPLDACAVKSLAVSDVQGLKVYAPDGVRYLVNRKDAAGTAQIYVAAGAGQPLVCISCTEQPGGPKVARFKMQPHWHASGHWIFLAVERDTYSPPPILGLDRQYVEGQLQNGLWTNMYVVSPDGLSWHRLTDFQSNQPGVADGFTGPALTHDGKRLVWSQIIDGNVLAYYPFGRWQLIAADFVQSAGVPSLANLVDITPPGMNWNEPGNFHPDNETVLLSGSRAADAEGMDQYLLNIRTGALANLTQSPTVWDEHGVFSPDGRKILFMSAYPYRDDPNASTVLGIKAEFMLMNSDGSGLTQVTHYKASGYPESSAGIAANGEWSPDGSTLSLRQLIFPDYQDWTLQFQGACGS